METKSNTITVHDLLGDKCIYQMPLFQREYSWKAEKQLEPFWNDLISVVDGEVDLAFLGAIVLQIETPASAVNSQVYTVIDGQQRISTFFLFVCAAVQFARSRGWNEDADDYEKQYLSSALSKEKGKAKLIPTFKDNANFNEVIKSIDSSPINFLPDNGQRSDGPMVSSFRYFFKMISEHVEIDAVADHAKFSTLCLTLFEKLEAVQIILDKAHDAHQVFDRLNTRGEPLSVIDLIRNELFQSVSSDYDKALALYDKHWYPFERAFEESLSDKSPGSRTKIIDGFFFPYALTRNSSTKKNTLFSELRGIWSSLGKASGKKDDWDWAVKVVADLASMRGPYLAVDQGTRPAKISDDLWSALQRIRGVPAPGVSHPYFMKLIEAVIEDPGLEAQAIKSVSILETFFVRRGIAGLEPTGLHAIFKRLWELAGVDPKEVFARVQTKTISFPNDKVVHEHIMEKPLYGRKVEKYVLASYEAHLQETSISKLKHLPDMTADHVMPAKWQGDWKKVISEEEHAQLKDTWGNLVPLSRIENSTKNAKNFAEAKSLLEHETSFRTTKLLMKHADDWTAEKIRERSSELAGWALKRWPWPA